MSRTRSSSSIGVFTSITPPIIIIITVIIVIRLTSSGGVTSPYTIRELAQNAPPLWRHAPTRQHRRRLTTYTYTYTYSQTMTGQPELAEYKRVRTCQ